MKRNKLKILLAAFLAVYFVYVSVLFNYFTASASDGSGMTQEEADKANGLYGSGNWTYDPVNDVVVPTEDAQKNLFDFLTSGFGIAYSQVANAFGIAGDAVQDFINKYYDDIAIKNDYLIIPKEATDEIHNYLKDNLIPKQGYYILNPTHTLSQLKGTLLTGSERGIQQYYTWLDSRSNDNIFCIYSNSLNRVQCLVMLPGQYLYIGGNGSSIVNIGSDLLSKGYIGYTVNYNVYSDRENYESLSFGVPLNPTSGSSLAYYGSPIKVFYSFTDLQLYVRQLQGLTAQSVYVSQKFYDYQSSDLMVDLNTYNQNNYTTRNETIYNNIVNNRDISFNENGTLNDIDLQLIIDTAIQKYVFETGGDNPGGDDDTPGGGGSGGSGGSGGTLVLPEETNNLLDKIYLRLNTISTDIKSIIDSMDSRDSFLQSLYDLIKDNFSNLIKAVENIEITSSDGDSLFDRILDYIFDQIDRVGDLIDSIVSETVGNLLADIIAFFIGDDGLTDVVVAPATALAGAAQSRFPTCIPWDIIAIIDVFSASPETPYFELPFVIQGLGINEKLVIDFEKAESLGELSRSLFTVTFVLFLVIQTRKLYGAIHS